MTLLLLAGLAGCADTRTGYPSLAQRPIEREVLRAAVAPPAAVTGTPPLPAAAAIEQIVASARTADAAFRAALDQARPAIEAGRHAAEGSEAWVAGQQAYSNADFARAPVSEALAELDRRRQAATAAGDGAEEAATIEALLQVQAIDEAERAQLAALMPS